MGHPSVPPPVAPPPSPPPSPAGIIHFRCTSCQLASTVAAGTKEFYCTKCRLPQMLPPELLPITARGIDPSRIQLPCARCKANLNVPHGFSRFICPYCGLDFAVDVMKLQQLNSIPPQPPEEINEVAIDMEREEDGGAVGETFQDYRPLKLSIGPPHPDPVVETSSLSAVQPPEPTYDLKIKDDLEKSKALSCLQIESIVYACQRHLQHLPNGARAGFFLGDGAGVGKGRTIAGLIWENWQQGRHKALWVSVGSDLKFDSRRDLDDVGALSIEVHALNKLPYSKLDSKSVGVKDGVVFLTYSTLIAASEKGRSRLQQLLQWCGRNYDGLLVFDECHKAKNLVPEAGSKSTRTGEAVLEIQARLPQARVLYCSATGASEPRNMGYMVRLGLWGAGTCFCTFQDFLVSLNKGGVGALELVAMDMKARGMYVCRTLSYKGAEFDIIEAPLDANMMEMYKKAAEFWSELRVELLAASAFLSEKQKKSGQLWRMYWGSHQRFFRHMCMSAKVPVTVRLAKEALVENKCVVIGLQSTGEARIEEVVNKYGVELDDFVSGPRELLLKLVEENYPLPLKPDSVPGEENVMLLGKRNVATSGVSFSGRIGKIAKSEVASFYETGEESASESDQKSSESDDEFQISDSSGEEESTESDGEFQICKICTDEEERKKMLGCSCCGHFFHPACLLPPLVDLSLLTPEEWSCQSCKEKTNGYLQEKESYIAEMKRYEAAKESKSKILEIIRSLDLPNNPLDDIINQLGGPDYVAEITGRRGMLVRASSGKGVVYQSRNTKEVTLEMINMNEKQLFMDGKKLVAIISEAGSAGVSLQADRRALNQRRRVHLTVELPWSADRAIQQFGRTHRSNQVCAPEYRLLFTNLGGERRFASIVAKRLETLGALTQGDRRAGPSLSAYNYDSAYGKRALAIMYRGIMDKDPLPVVPPACSSEKPDTIQDFTMRGRAALASVGIIMDTTSGNERDAGQVSGRIVESDLHDVGRFLNRLLGLPPDIQNSLFDLFISIFDLLIRNARDEGHFDSGIVEIKGSTIELQGSSKTVHVDQMSGAPSVLFTFAVDRGITWEVASKLLSQKQEDELCSNHDGFYESRREWMGGRHFLLAFEVSDSGLLKIFRPAVGEAMREMPLSELKNKYRKLSLLKMARKGWEDEYERSLKQCMHGPKCKGHRYCTVGRRLQEVNILGGLILPIWRTIEKTLSKQARESHKRLRIISLVTTSDNQRTVGLLIPNPAVESVLQDLSWVQEIDD